MSREIWKNILVPILWAERKKKMFFGFIHVRSERGDHKLFRIYAEADEYRRSLRIQGIYAWICNS
jgi:hypothetical protein